MGTYPECVYFIKKTQKTDVLSATERNVLNCPSRFGQRKECRFSDVLGNVVVVFLLLNESGDSLTGVAVGNVCGRMTVQLATLPAARSMLGSVITTSFIHLLHIFVLL
jgi:hypothetical protein